MLETVKAKIAQVNESNKSFDSYFFSHIMKMQDYNIESEVTGLQRRYSLQVGDLAKMINEECKQLSEMVEDI